MGMGSSNSLNSLLIAQCHCSNLQLANLSSTGLVEALLVELQLSSSIAQCHRVELSSSKVQFNSVVQLVFNQVLCKFSMLRLNVRAIHVRTPMSLSWICKLLVVVLVAVRLVVVDLLQLSQLEGVRLEGTSIGSIDRVGASFDGAVPMCRSILVGSTVGASSIESGGTVGGSVGEKCNGEVRRGSMIDERSIRIVRSHCNSSH